MTITNQPTGKQSGGSSRAVPAARLPSARERRPALAALAVLLIAGGAVLAGWLALRQSQTSEYLRVDQGVSKGAQLSADDFDFVELPSDSGSYVSRDDLSEIVDQYALVDMVAGQPLVSGMVGSQPETPPGQVHLGMNLIRDQYAPTLEEGDTVLINLLNGSDDGTAAMVTSGVVNRMEGSDSGDGAWIDVTIPAQCQAAYASASVEGEVAVVVVPPGEDQVTCATPDKP